MQEACGEVGVPPPAFGEDQGLLVVFRSSFTSPEDLRELGLTERQIGIVNALREQTSITNTDVQKKFGVSKRQATEDLAALEEQRIVERKGKTGRGTRYVLKGAVKGQSRDP
jgi:predicted HTH transcriptional regulator